MGPRDTALSVIAAVLLGGFAGVLWALDGAQLFALCAALWMGIYLAHAAQRKVRRPRRKAR